MQATRRTATLEDLEREEYELARRATAGDRSAFDQLYDRYFARMATQFSDLPPLEAQAGIREALEQLFGGLRSGEDPLVERAFRIARKTRSARDRLARG